MKEALKLALEALEDSEDHLAKPYSTDARRAITAIKEALAQHDVQHTGNGTFGREADVRPTGFFFQMPKPAQEPVAWNVIDPTGKIVATEENAIRGWARIHGYKLTVEGLLGFHEKGWRVVPATTPPQRKPLTRGQIREIEVDVSLNPSFEYITPAEQLCRAIEAAHGIKE